LWSVGGRSAGYDEGLVALVPEPVNDSLQGMASASRRSSRCGMATVTIDQANRFGDEPTAAGPGDA
jgi:hypothetical protein